MGYDFDPDYYLDGDFDEEDLYGYTDSPTSLEESMDNAEDFVYDTYDSIIGDLDFDPEIERDMIQEANPNYGNRYDHFPTDAELGLAMALADEISELENKQYDIDVDTDKQNMKSVNEYVSLQNRSLPIHKKKLRPFENFIDDICSGRRSIFDLDD